MGYFGGLWELSLGGTRVVMKDLIKKIDAFIVRNRMEPTAFGLLAINDGHLYSELKFGRKLRRKTVGRIEDFMKDYRVAK